MSHFHLARLPRVSQTRQDIVPGFYSATGGQKEEGEEVGEHSRFVPYFVRTNGIRERITSVPRDGSHSETFHK